MLMMAKRFGVEYVGEDNGRHVPVILHRAALGSLERFVGILLENSGGRLPAWMMRRQVSVIAVADRHADAANAAVEAFRARGVRAEADLRGKGVSRKIRDARMAWVPAIAVIGDAEAENAEVSLRIGKDDAQGMSVPVAVALFAADFGRP